MFPRVELASGSLRFPDLPMKKEHEKRTDVWLLW